MKFWYNFNDILKKYCAALEYFGSPIARIHDFNVGFITQTFTCIRLTNFLLNINIFSCKRQTIFISLYFFYIYKKNGPISVFRADFGTISVFPPISVNLVTRSSLRFSCIVLELFRMGNQISSSIKLADIYVYWI